MQAVSYLGPKLKMGLSHREFRRRGLKEVREMSKNKQLELHSQYMAKLRFFEPMTYCGGQNNVPKRHLHPSS